MINIHDNSVFIIPLDSEIIAWNLKNYHKQNIVINHFNLKNIMI